MLKHTTFEKKTMHHLLILFVNRNFSVDWLTRIYEISEKRLFFGGCGVVVFRSRGVWRVWSLAVVVFGVVMLCVWGLWILGLVVFGSCGV